MMSSSSHQQQQQQQQQEQYDVREQEYLSAQRAGIEAVHIGRDTLQAVAQQHEQLQRAEQYADESQYDLDRAGRLLRGMTWSGWVANMFTKQAEMAGVKESMEATATTTTTSSRTTDTSVTTRRQPPAVYENVPVMFRSAAQAVQNYHANVNVLESCETADQKRTCQIICNSMYDAALAQFVALEEQQQQQQQGGMHRAYYLQLREDLKILRYRQERTTATSQEQISSIPTTTTTSSPTRTNGAVTSSHNGTPKSPPAAAAAAAAAAVVPPPLTAVQVQERQQDAHLHVVSQTLEELGGIAVQLSESAVQQNRSMDVLQTKSDNLLETSRMVTRRADRMINSKSWTGPPKPVYVRTVTVQHIPSGKYLSVLGKGDVYLLPTINGRNSTFRVWKRGNGGTGSSSPMSLGGGSGSGGGGGGHYLFGLQSCLSGQWLGQTVFGNLSCSSGSFGHRQEWDAVNVVQRSNDSDDGGGWKNTKLVCASAGWGTGGYLYVRSRDDAVLIGGLTAEQRVQADAWCVEEYNT